MEDELKVKWRVGECLSGETEVLGGRSVPMPLRPPQIAETTFRLTQINPLNPELNPICYLLALLGVHHFLHVSRIMVKSLLLRLLMSYIYMERIFLMFLDHTQRRTTVGMTPLDE